MQEILNKLSRELNIPIEELIKVYKAYWRFIRCTIESLPLKEELDEEAFSKLKTNFNISNLGKLSCTYSRYKAMKNLNKRKENAEDKEN